MAFNLADMVNNRKPVETENISDTVYRDVFELEPSKENFYSTDPERLQGLKNSILLFGVMQDVLIEDVNGKDRIISGHCRTMCCRMLVEEGHEEFRKINCKYTKVTLNTEKLPEDKDEKVEQLLNKLGIIQANRFREKTDWKSSAPTAGRSVSSGAATPTISLPTTSRLRRNFRSRRRTARSRGSSPTNAGEYTGMRFVPRNSTTEKPMTLRQKKNLSAMPFQTPLPPPG